MKEYSIRALVYHLTRENIDKGLKHLEAIATRLASLRDEIKDQLRVLSTRAVFPPIRELDRKTLGLAKALRENGIDFVAVPLGYVSHEFTLNLLESDDGFFTSIPYAESKEEEIIRILRDIPERINWVATSRFGISFGRRNLTPYFPVTESSRGGVSVGLLYVNHIRKNVKKGGGIRSSVMSAVKDVIGTIKQALKNTEWDGVQVGVDASLSPWMEESVALLIEDITGLTFGLPGTFSKIQEINSELHALKKDLDLVGYNEVMISLAEDNRLKELARLNSLKFKDLLYLTMSCVAGLDMVYIPSSTDNRVVKGIFKDLETIRRLKGRSLGMRIGLVSVEPGEEIPLGRFGNVPVIDVE